MRGADMQRDVGMMIVILQDRERARRTQLISSDYDGVVVRSKNHLSLRATRAETRLTVYRALRRLAESDMRFFRKIFAVNDS